MSPTSPEQTRSASVRREFRQVAAPTVEHTRGLGRALGRALRAHDTVLFSGPIGAGKSELIRAAIRACGVEDAIPSPSFALAFSYPVERMTIVHADVYRLESGAEFEDLALEESFDDACLLIEWGERVAGDVDDDHLAIEISVDPADGVRHLSFTAPEHGWGTRLDAVLAVAGADRT